MRTGHAADGFGEKFGTIFAIPAIAEKGYLDIKIEVTTPGGHSSLPPEHTVRLVASLALREIFTRQLIRVLGSWRLC